MQSTSFKTWASFKVFQRFGCLVWIKTSALEQELACPANTVRYGCSKKPQREIKIRLARSAHSLNRSGTRFEARPFKTLVGITGFHLPRTTKWYPAANCMIERLHRYLTARLWCHAHEYWAEAVLLVFTGILNSRKKALETSSAELVYENPCIFRQYPSSNHSPTTPTLLTSKPGYFSTSEAPTLSASRHAKPRRRHIYGSNKNIARPPVKKKPNPWSPAKPAFRPMQSPP